MADKFQDTEKAFKSLQPLVVSLQKSVTELKNDLLELNDATKTNAKTQEQLISKTNAAKKASNEISDVQKERLNLERQLSKALDQQSVDNEELRQKIQEQKKATKELVREKRGLIGAYEKESKKLNELRKRYKDLAAAGKENTKESKNLRKEISKLDTKLKSVDKTVGQSQRNVGNYGDAMSSLPGPIGMVINSMKMLAKVIFATPLGWLIGLIAAAGAALKSFFVGSAEGQERWNKTMQKAKGTLSVFKDELISAGKGIADFGKNIRDSEDGIKGWANELGKNARKSIGDFFEDVKNEGAWDTLKDRATKAVDSVKGKINELQESIEANNTRAEEIANAQNKLRRDEIDSVTELAKIRSEVAEIRAKAADKENVNALERVLLLDKAIKKQNEILSIEEHLASERIRIQELEMAQGENRLEDYEELASLEKALIDLQTSNAEKRRRFVSEQLSSTREFKAEIKALSDESLNAADKELSVFMSSVSEIEAGIEDLVEGEYDAVMSSLSKQEEARLESYAKELEDFTKLQEAKRDVELEMVTTAQTILTDQFNAVIDNNLAKFVDSQEAQEDVLKNKLDKGVISEQEYEDQVAAIRLKTRIEEAKAEKKKALFDIAIKTATAVVAQLSIPGAGIGLAAAVAAIGALQAAAVAAKPLPKLEDGEINIKGKRHSQGGIIAEIEGGESVINRTGTGNAPKLLELINSGLIKDSHLPDSGVLFSGADSPDLIRGNESNMINIAPLINEQRKTRSLLAKMPIMHIGRNTIKEISLDGHSRKTRLDNF